MIKLHYIHVWKCQHETPVYNLVYINKNRNSREKSESDYTTKIFYNTMD
jgi:hypothetical protein